MIVSHSGTEQLIELLKGNFFDFLESYVLNINRINLYSLSIYDEMNVSHIITSIYDIIECLDNEQYMKYKNVLLHLLKDKKIN